MVLTLYKITIFVNFCENAIQSNINSKYLIFLNVKLLQYPNTKYTLNCEISELTFRQTEFRDYCELITEYDCRNK